MVNNGILKLDGIVEVDETYIGGKPRYKGTSKRGRGTKKTPVAILVERDGSIHSRPTYPDSNYSCCPVCQ